jgi:molecular chaperone GrpE
MPEEDVRQAEEAQAETTAGPAGDGDNPEALKQQLEQEQAKAAEYLDNWRRAAADLANYRKRMERESSEITRAANADLIRRLLPILDDFDRAFQTVPADLRDLTWVDGIMLIFRKMQAILELEGLKPIEALGKPFDPHLHEAVVHEETDKYEDGLVIGELQKGYMLNDRVLRPTLVKVAKKK